MQPAAASFRVLALALALPFAACAGEAYHGAWAYQDNSIWFGVSLEDRDICRVGLLVRAIGSPGAAGGGYWCHYSVDAATVRIHRAWDPDSGVTRLLRLPIVLNIAEDGTRLEVQSAGPHYEFGAPEGRTLTRILRFPD